MAEAHHLNIVHRDLKPANLFLATLAGRPCVKVLDFGVAKDMKAAKLTAERQSMGSPYYMSPEQMKDGSAVDPRSDIWALGVVLYELVSRQHVFDSDTMGGLFSQILMKPPTSLRTFRTDVPSGFEEAIMMCLQKDRTQRLQTVAEFAAAIAPFASPEFAAYPTRIAAAGRTQVPVTASYNVRALVGQGLGASTGSSIRPSMPSPLRTSAVPLSTTGASSSSIHLGASTLGAPQKSGLVAGIAIGALLSMVMVAGAGALYLRSRAGLAPALGVSAIASGVAVVPTGGTSASTGGNPTLPNAGSGASEGAPSALPVASATASMAASGSAAPSATVAAPVTPRGRPTRPPPREGLRPFMGPIFGPPGR